MKRGRSSCRYQRPSTTDYSLSNDPDGGSSRMPFAGSCVSGRGWQLLRHGGAGKPMMTSTSPHRDRPQTLPSETCFSWEVESLATAKPSPRWRRPAGTRTGAVPFRAASSPRWWTRRLRSRSLTTLEEWARIDDEHRTQDSVLHESRLVGASACEGVSKTKQTDGEIHEDQLLNFLVNRLDEEVSRSM